MARIQDLAQYLSNKHKISRKEAERFLTTVVDVLNDALHYEKQAKVKGLGTFKVIDVKDRESVNVNTGERIVIEGRSKITFTPDAVMKELVNKPFSQFDTVLLNDGVSFDDMPEEVSAVEDETMELPAAEIAAEEYAPETVETEPQPELEQLMEVTPAEEQADEEIEEELPTEEELPVEEEIAVEPQEPEEKPEESPAPDEIPVIVKEVGPVMMEKAPTPQEEEPEPLVAEPEQTQPEEEKVESAVVEETVEAPVVMPLADQKEEVPEVAAVIEKETKEEPKEETVASLDETEVADEPKSSKSWIWWLLGMMAFGALMYFTGYHVGLSKAEKPVVAEEKPVVTDTVAKVDSAQIKAELAAKEAEKAKAESLAVAKAAAEAEAAKKAAYDAEVAKQEAEEVSVNDPKALNNARNIVRTGAYNIIGTQQTVVVRKGQTLEKVSKAYLGPGMEAYLMVHNGVTAAKEGSTLKIPKLEVKKKH